MRTFTGFGVVLLLEIVTMGCIVTVLSRRRRRRPISPLPTTDDGTSLTAVLEIEDREALLPSRTRRVPGSIIDDLRADPSLGLADVRIVQHVQATGAGLPERSQVGHSYQTLNDATAKTTGPMLGESAPSPVPAVRLTWLALRLDLPGGRDTACVERAAEPIAARGGGPIGAARTLEKAVRTASAKLTVAGFTTTRLEPRDFATGLVTDRVTEPATEPATVPATSGVPAGGGGVLVGLDPSHQPVVLGLFGRRPLAVALVAGPYLAQLLALRAAAVGARVIVETGRDDLWDPLVLDSGLDATRLAIQPVGRIVGRRGWPAPSPTAPVLVLRDCGARPPYATTPHNPWTTIVTLLPYLDARTAGQLAAADLVGLQRMPPEEVAVARPVLGLTPKDAAAVPLFPDVMTLWLMNATRLRGRSGRYCETVPTPWETRILGDPARQVG